MWIHINQITIRGRKEGRTWHPSLSIYLVSRPDGKKVLLLLLLLLLVNNNTNPIPSLHPSKISKHLSISGSQSIYLFRYKSSFSFFLSFFLSFIPTKLLSLVVVVVVVVVHG